MKSFRFERCFLLHSITKGAGSMTFHDITPQTHPELFIPGTSFLKPIIDIIFKLLMSQNPRALKSLLTAVLRPDVPIKTVTIKSPNIIPRQILGKEVRLDVLVTLEDNTVVDIEMQTSHEKHFAKRAFFYTAQLAADALRAGDNYSTLPNICGIFIFAKNQFKEFPEAHSSFELARHIPPDGKLLKPGMLRLDFLELPKVNTSLSLENRLLWNWSRFFSSDSPEALKEVAQNVPEIGELMRNLETMSATQKNRQLALKRQADKRIDELARAMDIAEAREEAKAEGVVQGRTEGRTEGREHTLREAALKKLAKGLSHATIAEHLEITESELATLLAIANTTQTS